MSGAAFIELYFVLSSLFASRAYYAFGFLALTAAVVALTTATVTILFTYFILCAEDYRCVPTSPNRRLTSTPWGVLCLFHDPHPVDLQLRPAVHVHGRRPVGCPRGENHRV